MLSTGSAVRCNRSSESAKKARNCHLQAIVAITIDSKCAFFVLTNDNLWLSSRTLNCDENVQRHLSTTFVTNSETSVREFYCSQTKQTTRFILISISIAELFNFKMRDSFVGHHA
ncbi:hypothetical protein AVEN_31105-1 [Araneus ventricosus]|uniref:Uncharacterized protein n=1 Tax=Araneus ventricosus TaxID=182803 RepID=A0A4Y2KTK8_ARAVE|nr:hypothetical protein AVEN_31105-1 [Araneus ventricosus]